MLDLYKEIKKRPITAHQMDTDAIATAIILMSQNLDKLVPNAEGVFCSIASSLRTQLNALRERRYSAWDMFTGQGEVARRIREHAALAEIYHPVNTARTKDVLAQVEESFNKHPIKDEAQLNALQAFIKMTLPLMGGQQLGGQNFEVVPENTRLSTLKSGFYLIGPEENKTAIMVLNVKLEDTGVQANYTLQMGHDDTLLFYHPEEDEWTIADGSFTFDGLVSLLQYELDGIIEPMGYKASYIDMDLETVRVHDKVDYIFANHHRIKERIEGVAHDTDATTIYVKVSPLFFWKFADTRGKYPSRYYKFCRHIGDTYQGEDPKVLNELSRQAMFTNVHTELDRIIGSLVPEKEIEAQAA